MDGQASSGNDTIFALSSGVGRAGIAVLRISGQRSGEALRHLAGEPLPAPRTASLRRLIDRGSGREIDQGLILFFPGPHSATGEDVAELHVHGGRAVLQAVLESLSRIPGLRPAAAGEFTRRAFEQGKLDLTAAEGLADLVDADTEAQRRQALRQMGGALAALYDRWRGELVTLLAHVEAHIDFPEDGLPPNLELWCRTEVTRLQKDIKAHLTDGQRGERLRDGVSAAILGAPNSGKSSLINYLSGRDTAIVSAQAGTTRDVLEVHLDIDGYPVILADTAGLRTAGDEVETEGIRRALRRAEEADIKILMFDATTLQDVDSATAKLIDDRSIVILSRCDLADVPANAAIQGRPALPLSVKTGQGLDDLSRRLGDAVRQAASLTEAPALTRARHRAALEECCAGLARSLETRVPELLAEDLRLAVRAIGRITGRVDVEDILDVIFSDFCIGK